MKSDLNFERAVDKVETKQGEFLKQFNRLHKETEDLYHEVAMKIRMSDSAWEILYDILELGDGCLQRDICQISFIKKQTVGSAIRKLEKEGALYLKPGKGREMQIFLTKAGRRIVEERIELKRKINDNLDVTAQTLYQEFFIDNSDSSFWKQGTVGDVLQLQRGHDLPRIEMVGGEYPVAGSTGTIGYHNKFTAEAPVIVMGRSGNIGNPRLYLCNCWTHNTSLYVKQIYQVEPIWVFYLLKNLNYDGFVGGSAVPTLNRNDVHAYGIAIPPLELQKLFSEKVMKLIHCKEENLSEIEKLQKLQGVVLATISSR